MRQIDDLRVWRKQAIEAHMYDTAELVGDKVFAWSGHPDDAYWLAQTYYGMGEYVRGAALIMDHKFEFDSPRCRYIAALCLLQAQKLDQALALLTAEYGTVGSRVASLTASQFNSGSSTNHAGTNHSTNHAGTNHSTNHAGTNHANFSRQPGKVRVVSTSSLKAPGANGARTVSGSSRVSMILSAVDEDSLPDPLGSSDADELNGVYVDALLQFVLGRVYTLQSKFELAKEAYIAAMRIDARCFDAFAQLVKYHALTPKEESELLNTLDFSRGTGGDLAQKLYALRMTPTTSSAANLNDALATLEETYMIPSTTSDLLISRASQQFAEGRYAATRKLLEECLENDRNNLRAYTPYAAALFELGDANALYKCAHELAEIAPETAESWYAIGLYYLATQRIPEARAHFSRAGMVDPGNAPAWLGFARTFSEECEHEQAITAYSNVARLFPGYYLPYLCIGMQHLQLSNLNLAEKYLATAADFFEEDPLIMNELGVVFYHQGKLERSLQVLTYAAEVVNLFSGNENTRLSIIANTAHVLRRLGRVEEALAMFEQVCASGALDASVLSAMGLCMLQTQNAEGACEKLALALALSPDNTVTNDLLKCAMKLAAESFNPTQFADAHRESMMRRRIEISFSD